MSFLKRAKQATILNRLLEEKLHEQVLHEMEAGIRRDGLWAMALRKSRGSEEEAKGVYIGLRIQSIKDEATIVNDIYIEESKQKNHVNAQTQKSEPLKPQAISSRKNEQTNKTINVITIDTNPAGMNLLINGRHLSGTTPKKINTPRSPFKIDYVYNNELINTKKYYLLGNEDFIFEDFTEQLKNGFDSHPEKVKDREFHPGMRKCLKCSDVFMALRSVKCPKCGESYLTVPT